MDNTCTGINLSHNVVLHICLFLTEQITCTCESQILTFSTAKSLLLHYFEIIVTLVTDIKFLHIILSYNLLTLNLSYTAVVYEFNKLYTNCIKPHIGDVRQKRVRQY